MARNGPLLGNLDLIYHEQTQKVQALSVNWHRAALREPLVNLDLLMPNYQLKFPLTEAMFQRTFIDFSILLKSSQQNHAE